MGASNVDQDVADLSLLSRYTESGDMDAFSTLVDRHQADLLRLAHAILGDAAAAQDAVQEGFLALCRHAEDVRASARERQGLGGWLCTVVRNRCLDHLRKRRPSPLPEQVQQPTPPQGTSVDDAALLWAAVESLPPLERAAVVLRYRDELPYEAIAERLGKTANHVGVILNQAVNRLRSHPRLREVAP